MGQWGETHTSHGRLLRPSVLRLRELVREKQPTVWVWSKRSWRGGAKWEVVDEDVEQQSEGARRVEVLRDIDGLCLSGEVCE